MAASKDDGHKRIAENRKARFEYAIEDTWEAGIELTGTEVKSLRAGQANIAESYASAERGGIFLRRRSLEERRHVEGRIRVVPRRGLGKRVGERELWSGDALVGGCRVWLLQLF